MSDKDDLRRLAAEAERKRREQRDREIAERLHREADMEEAQRLRDQKSDQAFEKEIAGLLGVGSYDELRDVMRDALESDDNEISKAAGQYFKAIKGGNEKRAKSIAKKNKSKLREQAKKTKAKKGCLSVLILLVATGTTLAGGAVWGAVEVVSALAGR